MATQRRTNQTTSTMPTSVPLISTSLNTGKPVSPIESTTEPSTVLSEDDGETDDTVINNVNDDTSDLDDDSTNDDEITLTKKVYYLNSRPAKCPTNIASLPLLHWSECQENLHHTSTTLESVRDDIKILSPLYDCRFISLLRDSVQQRENNELEYIQVQVDSDFVYSKIATLLQTYATTKEEMIALFNESLQVAGKIKEKRLDNDLKAMAKRAGMTLDELLIRLQSLK